MTINFKNIYFTIYFLVISIYTIKLFYIQYKFQDRCLLWISRGKLMDLLFVKIK